MKNKSFYFFALCLLYLAATYLLIRMVATAAAGSGETLGAELKLSVGGGLLSAYLFFIAQRLLTGRAAVEYIVVMPVLSLISAFLVGAVLSISGVLLFGDPFLQALTLHALFILIIALRLWRSYWRGATQTTKDAAPL